MENSEENTYPNLFTAFIMRLVAPLLLAVVALALAFSWGTFLVAAPIIVKAFLALLLLLAIGATSYLAINGGMNIWHKHRRELREQQRHDVQLHLMQTRIHADERGNKASLITASGTVVNLPTGNYVQNVSAHYAPHITHHYPKAAETRIEEVPNVQAALPAPPVPTFSQLLESGDVSPHEVQSILGYTDGHPRRGDWDKLHSFFVVGISGSGKSSTVAYYIALAVMHGARLLVVDPDAEEEQSISRRIAPLSFALLTPVVSSPNGVQRVLEIAQREIAQPSNFPIVFVVDEFSTIMRSQEWADVAPTLAVAIEDFAQRGRKRGRTAIVIGQIAKATRTGGTELRASMTATFIHRVPAQQARMVIDSTTALAAPQLATGEVMVQLANTIEPYRMTVPYATEDDMYTVKSLMLRRSQPVSGEFQRTSNTFQTSRVSEVETDVKPLETEASRVSALVSQGYKKTQIIAEIWGAVPGGSKAYQQASQKFDSIVAEIEAEKGEA